MRPLPNANIWPVSCLSLIWFFNSRTDAISFIWYMLCVRLKIETAQFGCPTVGRQYLSSYIWSNCATNTAHIHTHVPTLVREASHINTTTFTQTTHTALHPRGWHTKYLILSWFLGGGTASVISRLVPQAFVIINACKEMASDKRVNKNKNS